MEFQAILKKKQQIIDEALDRYLPKEEALQNKVFDAMRYSVFAGGKRLRPILMMAACEFVNEEEEKILPFACGIEMIHTYSLIHDDLPAMDNDDYRRGKLTNHKVYGEGMAVLAGDGLLNYAYELMMQSILDHPHQCRNATAAMYEIAKAAGVYGMIGGQVVDLNSENTQVDIDTLDFIHNRKTGALFIAAIRAGAIFSGADPETLKSLTSYAENIGLGFQITDDILDIIGDEKKLGKKVGSDQENQKATYPSIHGLDYSVERVNRLFQQGLAAIEHYGEKAQFFTDKAHYLVKREY